MARSTIDFGIDLGTTNSEIAVLRGADIEVFKDNEGYEFTPSAVWLDPKNRLWVGRQAKEHLNDDDKNAFSEFKLQMGSNEERTFERSGRRMTPEMLSAEVLKALREVVKRRSGEDVEGAVITVPAAFELPQCEATSRAAKMAGLSQSPLLQEPVAAALAYGFQATADKVFWLVYDFGGGTFDAAVIQVRDGSIQVANHGGDNHLGGKLIDWAIVEQILMPAVAKEYGLTDLRRGQKKYDTLIAKLKAHAEKAKVRISEFDSVDVLIDNLGIPGSSQASPFELEVKKADIERLAEPFILRSINICRRVLTEKRLGPSAIEKVILVGGPTMMPYLRERLRDGVAGLGIQLESRVDPLTVVARGAAVFAGTQKLKTTTVPAVTMASDGYSVDLEYKPIGPDTEPLIAGKVVGAGVGVTPGFAIEFVNSQARPPWRSGKIELGQNGAFFGNLWAEKGRANTFEMILTDPSGRQLTISPSSLSYTVGMTITEQPLIHAIGVVTAANELRTFLEKGQPLPARKRDVLKTAFAVAKGKTGDVIRIPIVEGNNPRGDRNRRVGVIEVHSHEVKRDVPVGSEVEVTLDMDASRLIRAKAYVPVLDEEFEAVLNLGYEKADPKATGAALAREKERLAELRKKSEAPGADAAKNAIRRVDAEQMLQQVEGSLVAASADPDAAQKADNRLGDLRVALDEAEKAAEWPAMVAEAERMTASAREVVAEQGDPADLTALDAFEAEIKKAIQGRDPEVLRRRLDDLRGHVFKVLDRKGIMQVMWFRDLVGMLDQMKDRAEAEQLIARGRRAMESNDVDGMRAVNRQLAELLPVPPPPPDLSTVM